MASRSLNKVMLIGNLTRDPELRYTPQGTAVCTFGLATNRTWVSNGQLQEEAEFHRIVAWQKLAELCSQLLFKGRKAFVEGRLQTRNWTGKDGQERQTTEVVIDNMLVLDSRHREVEGERADLGGGTPLVAQDDAGQAQPKKVKKAKKEEKASVSTQASSSAKTAADKSESEEVAVEEEEKVSADDIPF